MDDDDEMSKSVWWKIILFVVPLVKAIVTVCHFTRYMCMLIRNQNCSTSQDEDIMPNVLDV